MDILKRTLAPITETGWSEIDEQARRVLLPLLSARKLVDVEGPKGWNFASVPLGRLEVPKSQPEKGVEFGVHSVQPLVEIRSHFSLDIWELDNIVRGAVDIDFSSLEDAAKKIAIFEEKAIFYGFSQAGIKGIMESSPHAPIPLVGEREQFLDSVSVAISTLLESSVEGPFGMAVSPEIWRYLSGYVKGYPLKNHLEHLLNGPVILSPFVKEAFLISMRGGDTQLILGQDLSIGYLTHDSKDVRLYITESFTFRVIDPSVIVYMEWKK
jgi:uncharacterized linocin/CFP29 family protein